MTNAQLRRPWALGIHCSQRYHGSWVSHTRMWALLCVCSSPILTYFIDWFIATAVAAPDPLTRCMTVELPNKLRKTYSWFWGLGKVQHSYMGSLHGWQLLGSFANPWGKLNCWGLGKIKNSDCFDHLSEESQVQLLKAIRVFAIIKQSASERSKRPIANGTLRSQRCKHFWSSDNFPRWNFFSEIIEVLLTYNIYIGFRYIT